MQVFANPIVSILNQFSPKSESMAFEIDLTLRAHLITLLKRQCEKTELQSTMELRNAPFTSGSNTQKAEQP